MKRYVLLFSALLFWAPLATAIEGVYVGGQVGHVGLLGDTSPLFTNSLGFSGDLAIRTNPILDVAFHFQASSHSGVGGSLTQLSPNLSANVHLLQLHDFDFIAGAGPGLYLFNAGGVSSTKFGLNFLAACDVVIEDRFRVGVGWTYHWVFSPSVTGASFWNVMARLGFYFPV